VATHAEPNCELEVSMSRVSQTLDWKQRALEALSDGEADGHDTCCRDEEVVNPSAVDNHDSTVEA